MNLDECKERLYIEKIIPKTSVIYINEYNNYIFNLLLHTINNYESSLEELYNDYYNGFYTMNHIHEIYENSKKILYLIEQRNFILSFYINIIIREYRKYRIKTIKKILRYKLIDDVIKYIINFD